VDPLPVRLGVELVVVELDESLGLQNGGGTVPGPGSVGHGPLVGNREDEDPRAFEGTVFFRDSEEILGEEDHEPA
jgi:hypothetical protein